MLKKVYETILFFFPQSYSTSRRPEDTKTTTNVSRIVDGVDKTENTLPTQGISSAFNFLAASWPNNRYEESIKFTLHSSNV